MGKEENKTQASHSRLFRPFSSPQNFSDYIEVEGTTKGEDDSDIQIKETEVDASISAYPMDKIPIQIRRLQLYKEALKNRQLKPSFVQWLCTDQCQFRCDHCDMCVSEPSLDGINHPRYDKSPGYSFISRLRYLLCHRGRSLF